MKLFRLLFALILLGSLTHGLMILWHYRHHHWPANLYNQPVQLQGQVVSLPQQKNHAMQFWFKTPQGLIQLNWYTPYPQLRPGESYLLTAKIKPDDFQNNPGEFDYQRYLRQQGVLASGYVRAKPAAIRLASHPWQTPIESLRYAVYQKILATTQGLAMQGILIALILGDKSQLNPVQWQVFTQSGTSYFMVISGLHIVLFALLCGLSARYIWSLIPRAPLFIPAQRIGLIIGLCSGLLYSILTGFSVPTQRALWMLWLFGIAKLFWQFIPPMPLLFATFLIVVAWNPLSFYSVAFWLSFIAVFFLIYTMSARWHKLNKLEEWLYPQWVMYFALLPPLVYVFHSFSVVSLLSNFIAIPIMMLMVIPLALTGGLFLFVIPPIGHFLFFLSNALMYCLWLTLKWSVTLPHAMMTLPQPSFGFVLLGFIGCLLLFAPPGVPMRFAGILLLLPLCLPKPLVPAKEVKITALKLPEPQDQAIVYETTHAVLIEQNFNTLRSAKSAAQSIIVPYLQSQGRNTINLWVINGAKNDHALRSLENSMPQIAVKQILLPRPFKTFDNWISTCQTPLAYHVDQVNLKIQLEDKHCVIKALNSAES